MLNNNNHAQVLIWLMDWDQFVVGIMVDTIFKIGDPICTTFQESPYLCDYVEVVYILEQWKYTACIE